MGRLVPGQLAAIDWLSKMALMCSTRVMKGTCLTRRLVAMLLVVLKVRRVLGVSKLLSYEKLVRMIPELSSWCQEVQEARFRSTVR
jgi:hypothetical protein